MDIIFGGIDMIEVSVIIPIYNGERYIRRCVQSVLNQTYKDFEIIAVDNNSVDNSRVICQEYDDKFDKFILTTESTPGPGCARNKGLSLAKGKYITFLDCDDYWEKDYLEKMINGIQENTDVDMVLCGRFYDKFFPETNKEKCIRIEKYKRMCFSRSEIEEDPCCYFKFAGTRGPVCKIFRTEIISENNIRFPEEITMLEDVCFCMEYVSHSNDLLLIDDLLYHQIIHQDSLSKQNKLDDVAVWKKVIGELKEVCDRDDRINWKRFFYNNAMGLPMQYAKEIIKNEKSLFGTINSIYNFLNRQEVKDYITKYCDTFPIRYQSKLDIAIYVIKHRTKLFAYKIINVLHNRGK